MKEIRVQLNNQKINKKLFSQALKAVSLDREEEIYYIDGNDNDVSLFSSYSDEIKLLEDKTKSFQYEILDEGKEGDKILFHLYFSFQKKFVLVTSNNDSFDEFFSLNEKYQKDFVCFQNDQWLDRKNILINPFYKGEKKMEDVFYDSTTLVLVSSSFLTLFNEFILSISNYFLKRFETNSKAKNSFFSNLSKNLFACGSSKEEKPSTLFDDLVAKFEIEYHLGHFALVLKEGNDASSFMFAIRFFLSLIYDELDFDPAKKKA